MGSILCQNNVKTKDDKGCTYCCQMLDINIGDALAQNRRNSLPCTVRTSKQKSCNQKVGCLQYDRDLVPLELPNGLAQ